MLYGYHVTTRNAALNIKEKGLLSNEQRIGQAVANPTGSFARNRALREPEMRAQHLKKYLAMMVHAGARINDILDTHMDEIPITSYNPGGIDPSEDRLKLEAASAEALNRFKERVKGLQGKKLTASGSGYVKIWKSSDIADAVLLFQKKLTHFLSRLAVQSVQFHYRIEELQTSTHVYFSEPKAAVQNYDNYANHMGRHNTLVVLRVDLEKVAWKTDMAQGGAIQVKDGVGPELLEIMEKHGQFKQEAYRMAPENWKPLKDFDAPKIRVRPRIDAGWSPKDA